jgi:hypothetical protein
MNVIACLPWKYQKEIQERIDAWRRLLYRWYYLTGEIWGRTAMSTYKNRKFEEAVEAMKKFDLSLTPDEREVIREYNRLAFSMRLIRRLMNIRGRGKRR